MLAVIIAIRVAKSFSESHYEMFIAFRKFPNGLLEPKTDREELFVRDIMLPVSYSMQQQQQQDSKDCTDQYILNNCTDRAYIANMLDSNPKQVEFAVVSAQDHYLLGSFSRMQLEHAIAEQQQQIDLSQYEIKTQPFLLAEDTSVLKTHVMMNMLQLDQSYVIRNGKLVGILRRNEGTKVLYTYIYFVVINSKIMQRKSNPIAKVVYWVKSKLDRMLPIPEHDEEPLNNATKQ